MSKNDFSGTFDRAGLLSALRAIAPVVEKHCTIPILSTVALEASGSVVKLCGSNLDIEILTECDAEKPKGRTAIPLRLLVHFLTAMTDDTVALATDKDGRITIRSGGMSADLTPMAIEDFPSPLGLKAKKTVFSTALAAGQLAGLMAAPRWVMTTEETRYFLCGIFFEIDADRRLRATATDGHRLISRATSLNRKPKPMMLGIVPAQTVGILVKAAADREVSATFSETHAVFVIGNNLVIRTKLIDGTYPNWRRVVPKPGRAETLPVRDLRRALRLCRFGGQTGVVFGGRGVEDAPLHISVSRSRLDIGNPAASAVVPATGAVRNYEFGVNARYLNEICAALGGDEITLNTADSHAPILIKTNNGSVPADIAVLMPVRV